MYRPCLHGRPRTKALSRKPESRTRINRQNFASISAGTRRAGNSRTDASSSSEEEEDFVDMRAGNSGIYASSSSEEEEEEEEPPDVVQEINYLDHGLVIQHVRVRPAAPGVPVVPPTVAGSEDQVEIIRVIPPPHRGHHHHHHAQSVVDLTSSDSAHHHAQSVVDVDLTSSDDAQSVVDLTSSDDADTLTK